jgi:ElaB/YqjD/DUF883 family membrane-anchored ribosome-binding protein
MERAIRTIATGLVAGALILVSASKLNEALEEDRNLLASYQEKYGEVTDENRADARQFILDNTDYSTADRWFYKIGLMAGVGSLTIPQLIGNKRRNSQN